LVRYIVVSNIPFTKVEVPEFVELIQYGYRGPQLLKMPMANTVKHKVLKLSDSSIQDLKNYFAVCQLLFSKRIMHDSFASRLTTPRYLSSLTHGLLQMDTHFLPLLLAISRLSLSLVCRYSLDIHLYLPASDIPITEEVLLDFQEIQGEHSGKNLAHIVWNTIELYCSFSNLLGGNRFFVL
jgi:hypothetical protein